MVMLEVVESSASADDEVILGRCQVVPKVRYEYDTPANLKWHQLEKVNAPFQQRLVVAFFILSLCSVDQYSPQPICFMQTFSLNLSSQKN